MLWKQLSSILVRDAIPVATELHASDTIWNKDILYIDLM